RGGGLRAGLGRRWFRRLVFSGGRLWGSWRGLEAGGVAQDQPPTTVRVLLHDPDLPGRLACQHRAVARRELARRAVAELLAYLQPVAGYLAFGGKCAAAPSNK